MAQRAGAARDPDDDLRRRLSPPTVAATLTIVQIAAAALSASAAFRNLFSVSPAAIYRNGELWRLVAGPLIVADLSWSAAALAACSTLIFGWHIESTQGWRRLLVLFVGGSVFAAALWSVAALVWNWQRPLFSPVGTTTLAVGALIPGLRRPFPAFLPFRVPVWVAFVAYAALWSVLSFINVIDLSAHFLAGLFVILEAQWSRPGRSPRTPAGGALVSTPRELARNSSPPAKPPTIGTSDAEFDQRVDALLQKITDLGYESLNEDEIALLLEASQRYRNRPPPIR